MKTTENATFEVFWRRVAELIGVGDTVKVENNEYGDEVITFYNSAGCPLSSFNLDTDVRIDY